MKDFCSIELTVKRKGKVIHQVLVAEVGRIPFLEAHKFLLHFEGTHREAVKNADTERET